MRTLLLILMVMVFHTTPAFGQIATSTATSTPLSSYHPATTTAYALRAEYQAHAQCVPEPPDGYTSPAGSLSYHTRTPHLCGVVVLSLRQGNMR